MPRHRVLTPLRWSDMDAYGHVNNVQFLRLLEDARVIAFGLGNREEEVFQVFDAGASGYVVRTSIRRDLAAAIRRARR